MELRSPNIHISYLIDLPFCSDEDEDQGNSSGVLEVILKRCSEEDAEVPVPNLSGFKVINILKKP